MNNKTCSTLGLTLLLVVALVCGPSCKVNPCQDIDIPLQKDLKALNLLLHYQTFDHNGSVLPAFSTQSLPAWASNEAAINQTIHDQPNITRGIIRSYGRAWSYRVPASVANRPWVEIGDEEVILEVVNPPAETTIRGLKKDLGFVWASPSPASSK